MIEAIRRYFNLRSDLPPIVAESAAQPSAPVLPQYLVTSAGVIVEPFLRHYIETSSWDAHTSLWGRILFGLIVGIILLPAIYKNAFDPEKPLPVQLAALFPLGIGWQSLFTSATKIAMGG